MEENTEDSFQTASNMKIAKLVQCCIYVDTELAEHEFQMQELQKRYEAAEDRITNETQSEIDSLYKNIKLRCGDVIENINSEFIQKAEDLKAQLAKFRTKLIEKTNAKVKKIHNEVEHQKSSLHKLKKELRKEINFLQRADQKTDSDDIQDKILILLEKHRIAIETHDKESQRKQLLFEQKSEENHINLENSYVNTVNELREKLRPPPQLRNQIVRSLKNMRTSISNLRNEIGKIRGTAKKLAVTNFSINSQKSREIIEAMKKENEDYQKKYVELQTKLQDDIFKYRAEEENLRKEQHSLKNKLTLEFSPYEEELKCIRDPTYSAQKRNKRQREEIERNIESLQIQVNEIKNLNEIHEKEINELKNSFEKEIEEENCRFRKRKTDLEEKVKKENLITEKLKEKEELQREKNQLLLSNDSLMPNFPKFSIKTEMNEVENLLNREYAKALDDKKAAISNYFSMCDSEIDEQKEKNKKDFEIKMALIIHEYKNDNVLEDVSKSYEDLFASYQKQLDSIEDVKHSNDNDLSKVSEYEILKRQKADLVEKTKHNSSELTVKFENLIFEENERFQSLDFFEGEFDFQFHLDYEIQNKKTILDPLNKQIAELEKHLNAINQANQLDESLLAMKTDSQYSIKHALQMKNEASKELIGQISEESQKYSVLKNQEIEKAGALPQPVFDSKIKKMNHKKENSLQNHKKDMLHEKSSYSKKQKEILTRYSSQVKDLNTSISSLRNSITEDDKRFNIEHQQTQIEYNKKLNESKSQLLDTIPETKNGPSFSSYDNQIILLTRDRDRKKQLFQNANLKMRDQEREIIDKLEMELCAKSKELAQLGKDLVIQRELVLKKEKELENLDNNEGGANQTEVAKPLLPARRGGAITSLNLTTKPKTRKLTSSVEIKRPNMANSGRILNFK